MSSITPVNAGVQLRGSENLLRNRKIRTVALLFTGYAAY
jgi:hypothetical protein